MTEYSIEQYATKCKLSKQAIYKRINEGKILARYIKNENGFSGMVIDIKKYPAQKAKKAGRKKRSSNIVPTI